ncbi:hypothetical protein [Humibacter albus]|nr:hypothetical protein [Humibacter albus]
MASMLVKTRGMRVGLRGDPLPAGVRRKDDVAPADGEAVSAIPVP